MAATATVNQKQQGRPFAGYKDFDACLAANGDKSDPSAYCGAIKNTVEGRATEADLAILKSAAARSDSAPNNAPDPAQAPPVLDLRLEKDAAALDVNPGQATTGDSAAAATRAPADTLAPNQSQPMGLNATLTTQPDPQRTDGAQLTSGQPDPQESQARDMVDGMDADWPDDDQPCVNVDDNGDCLDDDVVDDPNGDATDRSGSDSVKAGETGQDRDDDDKAKDARVVTAGPGGGASVLLPLQQVGAPDPNKTQGACDDDMAKRSLDASTKQEVMKDAKDRNKLIEDENIGVPVPGYGTGALGPTNVPKLPIAPQPTDQGGLAAPGSTVDMGATPPIVPKVGPKKGASTGRTRVVERRTLAVKTMGRAADDAALPDKICGRVTFVGLRYNEVDTYGTTFLPGCLNRSRSNKVPAKKVKLYRQIVSGEVHPHGVDTHVGVVTSVVDVGNDVVVTADIFDTKDGQKTKEYLAAAIANGGTGASIGFVPRASRPVMMENRRVNAFSEVELMEFTITPINSVPGTDILSVRADPTGAAPQAAPPGTAASDGTAARSAPIASMEQRSEVVRRSMRYRFR